MSGVTQGQHLTIFADKTNLKWPTGSHFVSILLIISCLKNTVQAPKHPSADAVTHN